MSATLNPTPWIWMDGQLVAWGDAKIHVLAHVVHYGSSVFEGLRSYPTDEGPAIFRLADHVRRLFRSARIYRMEPAMTREEIEDGIAQVIVKNRLEAAYIREMVTFVAAQFGDVHPEKRLADESRCLQIQLEVTGHGGR